MKISKLTRVVLLSLLGILVLFFVANIGLNFWLNKKLPQIIQQENNTPFLIKYQSLQVDLLARNIVLDDLKFYPKKIINDSIEDTGIYGNVAQIEIKKFNIFKALFSQSIKAQDLIITKPSGLFYSEIDKEKTDSTENKQLKQTIAFENIYLKDGNFKIINYKNRKPILSVSKAQLQLHKIKINQFSLQEKLPFYFDDFYLQADSLHYATKENYEIKISQVKANKSAVMVKDFSMINLDSRKQFVAKLPKEKDLFTLLAKDILISNINWGFNDKLFFLETSKINLTAVNANIYRNKIPKDDSSKKKLYSQMLRELPFNLKIDTLQIVDSHVVYEEEKDFEAGAGKLSFNQFNLLATNITGGKDFASKSPVKINIKNKFMNDAQMNVNWTFNVLDTKDKFRISGQILNLHTKQIEPFTKPYSNVSVDGNFESVYFDFYGNDINAEGNFILNQKNLNLVVYQKKHPEKVSKIKSAIGNLFIKKNAKEGEMKEVAIAVNRKQDRSVFNFLWLCLAEGLKKSLI